MVSAISLFRPNILEDGAFTKQHEGSVMKAILFAVASIFVVTAFATPSLARPLYQSSAESSSASGYQSRASRSAHRTARYRHQYTSRGYSARSSHRQYASLGSSTRSTHRQYAGRGHSTRSNSRRRCKASALVRLVDAHAEGWRSGAEPRPQLEELGPSERTARRRGRGLVPSCGHGHRTDRKRTVDRQVRQ